MADKITQRDFNEMRQPQQIRGEGIASAYTQNRDTNINVPRGTRGEALPPFLIGSVNTIYEDTILCDVFSPLENTTTGDQVLVFKPFTLRKTAWNGQTVTYENGDVISYSYESGVWRRRTATYDPTGVAISVAQEIAPDYAANELLHLAYMPTFLTVGSFQNVSYHDLNTAARGWANAL